MLTVQRSRGYPIGCVLAVTAMAVVCFFMASCTDQRCEFVDPKCCSDDELPPITTITYVGLFVDSPFGEALCVSDAVVRVKQGAVEAQLEVTPYTWGVLTEVRGEHQLVYEPANEPCNLYVETSSVFRHCSEPVEYEVQVPGCTPVRGERTWDENYLPERGTDISWHIPVILECGGRTDGGVSDGGGGDGA